MPARRKFNDEQLAAILSAFHTDEPVLQVGERFGVCWNSTIKRLWVEHFGEQAYKDRISRLYGLPKLGSRNPMWGKVADSHPRWVGDRTVSTQGYYLVRVPSWYTGPTCKRSRVHEHTVVACQMLGVTELSSELVVHHKNEDKFDNRPENLEVLNRGSHMVTHRWIRHRRKVQRLSRKGVDSKRSRSAQPHRDVGDDIV